MVATQLYFGLSKPDGTIVTTEQYQDFLSSVVSERFPDGWTASASRGQWRDQKTQRVVADDCRVLVLVLVLVLVHDGSARSERHLREIVAEYKRAFEQDAVMRADCAARVSF